MDAKYHFTHLKSKNFNILTNKEALDYLMKWSIKGQLRLTTFSFNESFQNHQKNVLIEDFFKDAVVTTVLNQLLPCWRYTKDMIEKVELEVVRCTVSSLTFFDRLSRGTNDVVTAEGYIRHCLDDVVDGFMVADELRKMLIVEESDNYGLFSESDRSELIFKVFRFLVLGGEWCQYEDRIAPYLHLTKILYKDLLRVEKNPETKEIEIKSVCLKDPTEYLKSSLKLLEKQERNGIRINKADCLSGACDSNSSSATFNLLFCIFYLLFKNTSFYLIK